MLRVHPLPLAGVLLVAFASSIHAGVNTWTVNGPDGGATHSLLIDPDDAAVRLAATSGGLYRSSDSGLTWQFIPTDFNNPPWNLTRDPTNHDRILATAGSLVLSTDRGLTFVPVQGPPTLSSISKIAYGADGSVVVADLGGRVFRADGALTQWSEITGPWSAGGNVNIGALAIAPAQPGTLFVGVDYGGLYRSTNSGADWSGPLAGGSSPLNSTYIYSIAVDPLDSSRVLAATLAGVWRSANSGDSWTQSSNTGSYWVGWDPHVADRAVLVAIYGTIIRSVDGGASFTDYGAELRLPGPLDASFDPHNANHLWIASYNGPLQSTNAGGTFAYRTAGIRAGHPSDVVAADDGTILVAINAGGGSVFRRDPPYISAGNAALRAVTSGPFHVQTIAIAANNSARIFAVNNCSQLVHTVDGGATWSAPHPQFSGGFDCIANLRIDPSNELIAYASRPNSGLWRTIDGGTTWTQMANSPRTAGFVGIDPSEGHLLLVGGDGAWDRIYKSTDGGLNWSLKLDTQQTMHVVGFAFDPEHSDTVYAYGYGGVRKSTDAGETWSPFAAGVFNAAPVTLFAIDPLLPTTLIAAQPTSGIGFVRSVDGGLSWDVTPLVVPMRPLAVLHKGVLDPSAPHRLIIGASGIGVVEYDIAPDLQISVEAPGPTPAALGSTVAVGFTVRNLGPHASSDSIARIPVPDWEIAALPSACVRVPGAVECSVGVLRVNQSRRFDLDLVAPAAAGSTRIDLTVAGHEADPVAGNNVTHIDLVAAELADLAVSFPGAPADVDNRATVTLPIDVRNAGPNASSNTVLAVQFAPPGQTAPLSDVAVTSSQGSCSISGISLECTLGTLPNGVTVHVVVTATASSIATAEMTATADGAGIDSGVDQNATHTLRIRPVGDFAATVSASANTVTTGIPWQYTATVRNNGPDASTGRLLITLNGATPATVTLPGGTCAIAGAEVSCTLQALESGAAVSAIVNASSTSPGTASVTATASFDGTDTVAANDSATLTTTKQAPPQSPDSEGTRKGGGGIEWLTLLALMWALWCHWRRTTSAASIARS